MLSISQISYVLSQMNLPEPEALAEAVMTKENLTLCALTIGFGLYLKHYWPGSPILNSQSKQLASALWEGTKSMSFSFYQHVTVSSDNYFIRLFPESSEEVHRIEEPRLPYNAPGA